MALAIRRRILGSIVNPIKNLTRQVTMFKEIKGMKCNAYTPMPRIFKGIQGIKCNAFLPSQRQPVIRFRKGNYRRICQSSLTTGFCMHPKSFSNSAMIHHSLDTFRLKENIVTKTRYSFTRKLEEPLSYNWQLFPGTMNKPVAPFVKNWMWYAQAKNPGGPSKEPYRRPGGNLRKVNASNELEFEKMNQSKLQQIKQMLKDKAMLKGTDNAGKKSH